MFIGISLPREDPFERITIKLNYDLNYIDYPNINDVELTTGLKLLVLSVENHKGEKKFIILAKHAKLHNAKFVTNFLFFDGQ